MTAFHWVFGPFIHNPTRVWSYQILSRLTPNITHIVFKSGSPTTLAKYHLYDDPKPFLVGIGWVVECVEKREKADERTFLVDEPGPVVMYKVCIIKMSVKGIGP